jgi:RND family efflux transporter MFP subunit
MKSSTAIKLVLPLAAAVALTAMAVMRRDASPIPKSAPAPAPDSGWVRCEGRVAAYPGYDLTVGTELGGTLESLAIHEKDTVRKGQLLARIDDREQRASLEAAEAHIREQGAEIAFQEKEVARRRQLFAQGALDRRSVEDAENQLHLAQARQDAAKASADQFRAQVAKRQIQAPIDGVVLERFANAGETLAPGARILRLANLGRTRIEAEVDEFDVSSLKVGNAVEISSEGTRQAWRGKVEELPDGVGPRRLKPQDPSRPTDIRVLLVKVALDETAPLKLGQKVELRIRPAK